MGLRGAVIRSTGSRNGVPVYYKGTQALPKKQSGSIGKARPEQNAVCVSDMEANGLHNSACAEAAENGKQHPNCLSSQNRGDGASGREKTAGQNKVAPWL